MKQIKLVVLSLLALAFARPPGFCTANTHAEDIADLKAKLDAQAAEIEQLRAASNVALAPVASQDSSLELLIKGAGVDKENVLWRIRAGLDPAQAVEVALAEKTEAEAAKKEAKK